MGNIENITTKIVPISVELEIELKLQDGEEKWWGDKEIMNSFIEEVQRHGLWVNFKFLQNGRRYQKIKTINLLMEKSTLWKENNRYTLMQQKFDETHTEYNQSYLSFRIQKTSLIIRLQYTNNDLFERLDTILDRMVSLVVNWTLIEKKNALLERCYILTNIPYPRLRPPRTLLYWPMQSIVDIFSTTFHQKTKYGLHLLKSITTGPLPSTAMRTTKNDLTILHWVDDLKDIKKVQDALSVKEKWIAENLNPSRHYDYNELGDLFVLNAFTQHPPLSYYCGFNNIGYKLVVANEQGEMDEDILSELKLWLHAGALPDGKLLKEIILIVPTRDAAINIYKRMRLLGFSAVYYIDNNGYWWNPFPPGLWLDTPN